jgi:hypothetical protein
MRSARVGVAAAILIILSAVAHAAEYQYFNMHTDPRWRSDLVAWLTQKKPTPDNVSIAMTPAGDIHTYVVPGAFAGIYSIERIFHHPTDRPNALIRAIIDGGTGRMIGFARSASPSDGRQPGGRQPASPGSDEGVSGQAPETFDVYILTWTKPPS